MRSCPFAYEPGNGRLFMSSFLQDKNSVRAMKKGRCTHVILPFNSNFPPLSGHNTCAFTMHVSDATSAQRGPPQVDTSAHYQLHNRYRIYFKITNNYLSLPSRPPAVSDINFPHTALPSLRQSHRTLFDLSVRIVDAWSCFNWVSIV